MALLTLGTNATTSLSAQLYSAAMAVADIATINNGIKDDQNPAHPVWPGAFEQSGLLFIPRRGVLKVLPGDYVAYDTTTGWPILLSAYAIASGPYTHS
jgi:hypothetical protein